MTYDLGAMKNSAFSFLVRNTAARPLARALALVAFLCAGALQVEEASHWHADGDSYAHCLVCKSSSGAALPLDAPIDQPMGIVAGATKLVVVTLSIGDSSPFLARGPPLYS